MASFPAHLQQYRLRLAGFPQQRRPQFLPRSASRRSLRNKKRRLRRPALTLRA